MDDLKPVRTLFKAVLNSLITVVFPSSCVLCRAMVEDVALGVVCLNCWKRVNPGVGEICSRCGYFIPSTRLFSNTPLCGSCRRNLFHFDFARAYSTFNDPIKEIVHQFKYHAHQSLARPLSSLLFQIYSDNHRELWSDLVIPIPLHKARERERGFNQSFLLAKYFCRQSNLSLQSGILVRGRPTATQAGLSRRARRLNMAGAFRITAQGRVQNQSVLLIDDVFTTGATLNECARLLKEKGARRVNVLTLARVTRN